VLVIGVMADKDVDAILRMLLPAVSSVITTAVDSLRALDPDQLRHHVTMLEHGREVRVEADPHTAIDRALDASDRVCVAGSIYLAGAVRDDLKSRAILQ
jgi:dihydrofolate synthase/folylpolyglutamate synthase